MGKWMFTVMKAMYFPKNRSVHVSLYLEWKMFLVCLFKSWDGNMQIYQV